MKFFQINAPHPDIRAFMSTESRRSKYSPHRLFGWFGLVNYFSEFIISVSQKSLGDGFAHSIPLLSLCELTEIWCTALGL